MAAVNVFEARSDPITNLGLGAGILLSGLFDGYGNFAVTTNTTGSYYAPVRYSVDEVITL